MKTPSDPLGSVKHRRTKRKRVYAALAVLLLAAIVLLTMLPASGKQFLHTRGHFHSAGHILAFTALAFTVGRTTRSWRLLLALFTGLVVFGFCTELAEHLLFNVTLEWKDVAGDSFGAFLGLSLAILTRRHRTMSLSQALR